MSRTDKKTSRPPNALNHPLNVAPADHSSDDIDREDRRRRALSIVGAFSSDVDDLSVNHDRYLAEAYADAAAEE